VVHRNWKSASFVFAAMALLLAGCLFWQFTRHDSAAAKTDIATLLDRQKTAWNRGDLDGFMAEYWMSDSTTMSSGGDVRNGWTVIMDRYRKTYQAEGRTMGTLDFKDVTVEPLAAGVALARGRWVVQAGGAEASGLFTLLLKKIDGQWKIVHDHTSKA
jgi:uncharacterized protein (TIGR02246 family)